ncbi:MAG TPA: hypothetical protein VD948_02785 [Rhodothermales bacterium]|nr:hypothetical protein [Rhodothermales bacterium]
MPPLDPAIEALINAGHEPAQDPAIEALINAGVAEVEPSQKLRIESAAKSTQKALGRFTLKDLDEAERAIHLYPPEKREEAVGRVRAARSALKGLHRQAAVVGEEAKKAQRPDLQEGLQKARESSLLGRAAKGTVAFAQRAAHTLEAPKRAVQRATLGATDAEFSEELRRRSEDPISNPISAAYRVGTHAVGAVPGVLGGALAAGIGAISDIPGLARGERTLGDVAENAGKTVLGGIETGGEAAEQWGSDPLSYLGSAGGAGKSTAATAARLVGKIDPARAKAIAPAVERLVAKMDARHIVPDTVRAAGPATQAGAVPMVRTGKTTTAAFRDLKKLLLAEGVPEDEIRRAFGAAGEYVGVGGQFAVNPIPMAETMASAAQTIGRITKHAKAGEKVAAALRAPQFELGPALGKIPGVGKALPGGGEHMGRRALNVVYRGLVGKGSGYYEPTVAAARAMKLGARAQAHIQGREFQEGFENIAAGRVKSDGAPATLSSDKKRRIEQAMRYADPDLYAVRAQGPATKAGRVPIVTTKTSPPTSSPVTAAEKAGWQAIKRESARQLAEMKRRGVRVGESENPEGLDGAGFYFPRMFRQAPGVAEELSVLDATKKAGGGFGFKTARGGEFGLGTPLGALEKRPWIDAIKDPYEAFPIRAQQYANAIAKERFRRWMAKHVATRKPKDWDSFSHLKELEGTNGRVVPAAVKNFYDELFSSGPVPANFADALRKWVPSIQTTPLGRAVLPVADAIVRGQGMFKQNVLMYRPAFHTVNPVNEAIQMTASGMANPLEWLNQADNVIDPMKRSTTVLRTPGGAWSGAQLFELARRRFPEFQKGATKEGLLRFSEPSQRMQVLSKEAHKGSKAYGSRAWEQWKHTGEGFQAGVADRAKLGVLMYRLQRGDPVERAVRVAMDTQLDYGDRNDLTNLMRLVMPFGTFFAKSPAMVAKAAVRNPAALTATSKVLNAAFPQEGAPEPRRYMTERSPTFAVQGDRRREVASNLRQMFGGQPLGPHETPFFISRDTFIEPLVPYAELAGGNLESIGQQLGPATKMAAESLAEKDIIGKRPMSAPTFLGWEGGPRSSMFPAATPFVPEALLAKEGQNPWLTRYFSGYLPYGLGSPLVLNAANRAFGGAGGDVTGPAITYGAARPLAQDRDNLWALQALGSTLGYGPAVQTPLDPLWNVTHDPDIEQAKKDYQALKAALDLQRREQMRGR